jgi:hypothetical protein
MIKRQIHIFLFFLFFSFTSFGQKDSGKILFSVNAGIGIPLNFQHSSNYTANFTIPQYEYLTTIYGTTAKQGISISSTLIVPIKINGWSIVGVASYYKNGFENIPGESTSTNYFSGYALYNLQGIQYTEYDFLIGLMKTFTKNKFSFNLFWDIGYANHSSPEITFMSSPQFYDISANEGGGIALDIGTSLRYKILKKIYITFNFDLYYSSYTYAVNYTVNPEPPTYINGHPVINIFPPANIAERMYLVNITGGLAYQLGK